MFSVPLCTRASIKTRTARSSQHYSFTLFHFETSLEGTVYAIQEPSICSHARLEAPGRHCARPTARPLVYLSRNKHTPKQNQTPPALSAAPGAQSAAAEFAYNTRQKENEECWCAHTQYTFILPTQCVTTSFGCETHTQTPATNSKSCGP